MKIETEAIYFESNNSYNDGWKDYSEPTGYGNNGVATETSKLYTRYQDARLYFRGSDGQEVEITASHPEGKLTDDNKGCSSYYADLNISDDSDEWNDFSYQFGNTSLLKAITEAAQPNEGDIHYNVEQQCMEVWSRGEWIMIAGRDFNQEQDEKLAKLEDENGLLRKFGKAMLESHYTPNEEGGNE